MPSTSPDPFVRYLRGLTASWRGLASGHEGAAVVEGAGFVTSRHPLPVLDNAVLLEPSALPRIRATYPAAAQYAVWTLVGDDRCARLLESEGFARDVTTTAMIRDLGRPLPLDGDSDGDSDSDSDSDGDGDGDLPGSGREPDVGQVAPAVLATLNAVPPAILDGVPGLRCWATRDAASGLALQDVGDDVVVSFVATRPESRRRGLATRVLTAALADAQRRGAGAALLQATPEAVGLYARLDFVQVAVWQEWVPASRTFPVPSCSNAPMAAATNPAICDG